MIRLKYVLNIQEILRKKFACTKKSMNTPILVFHYHLTLAHKHPFAHTCMVFNLRDCSKQSTHCWNSLLWR